MKNDPLDSYGSMMREVTMKSMSKPAGYYSRKASFCERHSIGLGQRTIAIMALICIAVEMAYQIGLKVAHHG